MNRKNPYEDNKMVFSDEELFGSGRKSNVPDTEADDVQDKVDIDMEADEELLHTTREDMCGSLDPEAAMKEAEEVRLRALAEMENYKKRLQREHAEQAQYATEKVLADLLPTLDNFDLALQYGSQVEACKDVLMGVEMTKKLLLDAVKDHGLVPLGQAGEEFDPNLHEAIGKEASTDVAPGHIVKVLLKGYKLKERLLRPAKVIVNA